MGRLIDTDSLKDRASEYTLNEDEYRRFCEIIDAESTAYDPVKVVKQMEDKMKELNEISKGVNMTKILERQNHGYYTAMEHAIEIVKGGGVDGKSL